MKHCPKCKRTYADESQRYCLDDGTVLVDQVRPADPNAPTLLMPPRLTVPQPQPAPTVAFPEKNPNKRRRRWPILVALMALIVPLLLIGVWWLTTNSGDELLYQTRADNLGKMRVLLLLGADVNARDRGEGTPLMGAAWRGQTEAVKILLAHGAAVNARNKSNETPLILAAKEGHADIVRLILDKNPDLNAKDSDGWTCLMWAAWAGYDETVQLLLSTGIKVGTQNNLGETALTLARRESHYEVASRLEKETSLP